MHYKNSSILLFIFLTMPHQGYAMTPQPADQSFLQKIMHLPRLFAAGKQQQNKPSEQSHLLRRRLVWAAALAGALIIGYMFLRQRPSDQLPPLPPAPTNDPALTDLRRSTEITKGLTNITPNAFDAGKIQNQSLEALLRGRLPQKPQQ